MSIEIFVHQKGSNHIEEGFKPEDLPELLNDEDNLIWVDLEAPTVAEEQKILANIFHFHQLSIEDARETRNQPKVESYPHYLFFIVHGVKTETTVTNFVTKELDGFLGRNFVVTYHHEKFRSIDNVKRQIRDSAYICGRGADYLLHHILDEVIDLYMPLIDDFDEAISELGDRIFHRKNNNNEILEEILLLKRSVARLKRVTSKQLNVIYRLAHGEFPLIEESHLPFYRDVFDHLQRVADMAENYREMTDGLLGIQFNVVNNRTNEVVKILTIFSAIMLPLSLIAGIYGMNFENMPELKTANGYYLTLGFMALVAILLLTYFWHKGWIFAGSDDEVDQHDHDEKS